MGAFTVVQIPVLEDNYVYLIHEPDEGKTAVVDPSVAPPVLAELKARGWKLDFILNTHHHMDHVGGNLAIKEKTGCRVVGPYRDTGRIPGMDEGLTDKDPFTLGAETFQIVEIPGHTTGHIAFYNETSRALFCGDTLFSLGCGRLFEGTPSQMWASIKRLKRLPDDTLVYCGHEYTQANGRWALTVDPQNKFLKDKVAAVKKLRDKGQPTVPSTLGEEKATNPFLRPGEGTFSKHLGIEGAGEEEIFAELRRNKDNFR